MTYLLKIVTWQWFSVANALVAPFMLPIQQPVCWYFVNLKFGKFKFYEI